MNRGQIFSIDLLFGVIILLLGIGILLGAVEINTYNQKQQIAQENINQKTILAAQVITNSTEWDCNFDQFHAAYSINRDKFGNETLGNTLAKLKEKTTLMDYNIKLILGTDIIYDEISNSNNIVVFDLNVLTCKNTTDFNMLKNCVITSSICYDQNIKKETLRLMVAK